MDTLARPQNTTAALHRTWLRQLPALTGKSLSRVADEAGVARTTLTNKIKPEDAGISTLNAAVIERIMRTHNVPGPDGGTLPGTPPRSFGEDAAPYEAGASDPFSAVLEAIIGAANGVVPWTLKTRALELAGYLPGDIVLVDLNAAPRPGDAVCAQVYDWQRMQAETVMRIYERASAVDLLLSRSNDPAFNAPILVDGERVIIKGVLLPHRLRRPLS